ncbi:ATPase AAA [Clostridia bacterium]|nr:ATPase AAA [Clostridia bacterium]
MFIGRESELQTLEKLYAEDKFQFPVFYGRRRVGKTSLITEFLKGKRNIYYVAAEQNNKAALEAFSEKVFETYPEGKAYMDTFKDWRSAFEYIVMQAKNEKIIVAIDEYPYIAQADKSISSVLQAVIDTKMLNSKIFLILCGSSMSFMENQVLGYKSPLYGRRTAQFKVMPFDYFVSGKFFDGYSPEEKILAYSIVGGIPQYLRILSDGGTLNESIVDNLFSRMGHLFEEPSSILKQELREPAVYNSIIAAIAQGATRLNEIATKTGEGTNKCGKYLKSLFELRIVEKQLPITGDCQRNGIYRLCDNLFRFWYKYVLPNMAMIETGNGKLAFQTRVLPTINEYVGGIFEECAISYIWLCVGIGRLPIQIQNVGRWWGNNPAEKREEEIDLVAVGDNAAIFGECKWRNEPQGVGVLNDLTERSRLLKKYKERHYMIFSKSGFTEGLIAEANRRGNVALVTPDDMFFAKQWK